MTVAKGIWIPPSARESEREQGSLGCYLCKRQWPKRQRREYEGHFRRCIEENMDAIRQESLDRRLGGMLDPVDPEVAEHMAKVGETMKREGRLTVKPNERAGFS